MNIKSNDPVEQIELDKIVKTEPKKISDNLLLTVGSLLLLVVAAGLYFWLMAQDVDGVKTISEIEMAEVINLKSPNILLIIADDMGMDTSPWHVEYKGQKPHTPVLDALAKDGLVFDNVWANPLCSPTRSGILTGKYGVRTGVLGALAKKDVGVLVSEYSLQSMIRDNAPVAYSQAVIGKWHLSTDNNGGNDNPNMMGVPHYVGYPSGMMQDYNKWKKVTNGVSGISTIYATTDFTNEAINWIDTISDEPWFLWLAYTAPHTPFHMPPAELLSEKTKNALFGSKTWEKN